MEATLSWHRNCLNRCVAVVLLLVPAFAGADPGFGSLRKKKLDLETRSPAVVRLANTSFAVIGSADRANSAVLESLLPTLETELLSNEKSLTKKPQGEAEYTIGMRITSFSIARPQAANGFVHWVGSIRVSYQVLGRGGKVFDAGNVRYTYDKNVPASSNSVTSVVKKIPGIKRDNEKPPQSAEDLKEILVGEVVREMSAKLGNTKQSIQVEVAGGDDHLNRAADFMDKQLWSRALDELEKMTAFPKAESEAYRQYDLGLVHEAMAYEAKTLADQKENLLQAQEYYDKALEGNQKEKYFVVSVARTKEALARYKAFESMQKEERKGTVEPKADSSKPVQDSKSAKASATTSTKSYPPQAVARANTSTTPSPLKPQTQKSGGKTLRVGDVVEMFNSHVPEDQIIAIIRSSSVQFDPLDKDTAIAVAKAGLPVSIQNEMRAKVGAPLLGPSKAATKK
jgi:tetratricopeptide (TPR) repeat protein